jgi:predicted phosphodiesterase
MRKVYLILILLLIAGFAALGWRVWHSETAKEIKSIFISNNTNSAGGISFAVIGDNEGENSIYNSLIQKIANDKSIQFVIHVGDATSQGSQEELTALQILYKQLGLTIPVYAVPGNHDIKADPSLTIWKTEIGNPWRSIDINNIHLVLLDNANRKVGFPSEELDWLERDLSAVSNNKTIILAYHRPFNYPLASIVGDDETTASRKTNERFLDIIKKYPIAHIFTGHIHTSLDYTMTLEKDADGNVTKSVPVTISGGGGQPPQSGFGGLLPEKYHALKATVQNNIVTTILILP